MRPSTASISSVSATSAEGQVEKAEKNVLAADKGHKPKLYVRDENDWQKMLAETKPDAVFIATPWDHHAPMCIAAMKAGAHAFTRSADGLHHQGHAGTSSTPPRPPAATA
ncbi:MAG: Gfo/Idh/MocA family oxidoreductase [Luteolibacter sp.]